MFMQIKLFYYKIPLQVLAPVILHIIEWQNNFILEKVTSITERLQTSIIL